MIRLLLAVLGAALCGAAQDYPSFSVKHMSEWDEHAAQGRCVMHVLVDGEIDVELQGEHVSLRTLAGQPGTDEGSECSQPLPAGGYKSFSFRKTAGRGDARLVQEPRPGNSYMAIVAVRDDKAGADSFTFELNWEATGSPASTSSGGGILPNLPVEPAFTGLQEVMRGTGTFRAGSREEALRRVWMNLQPGGTAQIVVYGKEAYTMSGTWQLSGDVVELDLRNGFGTFGVTAKGQFWRTPAKKLEISGQSGRFPDSFALQFSAATQ